MEQQTTDNTSNKHVHFYGHVAKFPKNVKAKSAYLFLENIKVPRNKTWYLLIEKQNDGVDELQMLKYNRAAGVNLQAFVNELCGFYATKYQHLPEVLEALTKLEVVGEDKFSVIRNIAPLKINGMPMVSRIMLDLIDLLA